MVVRRIAVTYVGTSRCVVKVAVKPTSLAMLHRSWSPSGRERVTTLATSQGDV